MHTSVSSQTAVTMAMWLCLLWAEDAVSCNAKTEELIILQHSKHFCQIPSLINLIPGFNNSGYSQNISTYSRNEAGLSAGCSIIATSAP